MSSIKCKSPKSKFSQLQNILNLFCLPQNNFNYNAHKEFPYIVYSDKIPIVVDSDTTMHSRVRLFRVATSLGVVGEAPFGLRDVQFHR